MFRKFPEMPKVQILDFAKSADTAQIDFSKTIDF